MNEVLIQHNIQVLKQLEFIMDAEQKVEITDELFKLIRETVLHDYIRHLIEDGIYIKNLC